MTVQEVRTVLGMAMPFLKELAAKTKNTVDDVVVAVLAAVISDDEVADKISKAVGDALAKSGAAGGVAESV